ncbi:MAG: LON peptidase substrate-binding domain-containing protein [Dehalococcoidia bacterium]
MTEPLRLFPLNSVLFPGMPLPLQVFEDRYRTLVSECLADGEPFGVALIREGAEVGRPAEPFTMGVTARLEQVTPLPDGRLAVAARGDRRFRITRLLHDRPYLAAEVEYPVDEATAVPPDRFEQAADRYVQLRRLRLTVEGGWVREVPVPASPGALADAIGTAGAGAVPPRQLQPILEAVDVRRRLERAEDVLSIILEATHRQAQQAVASRWGGPEQAN